MTVTLRQSFPKRGHHPSSGTGAWEAALSNTLSPGDKVLAPRFGQFSHLWIDLSQRIGLDVVIQDEEWGVGASPDRIEDALRADRTHAIKGVLYSPQRDRHRCYERHRRGTARDRCCRPPGDALR